jgi:hypothetical protein
MVQTLDPVNGGAPLGGLAGRMYLFGPDLPGTKELPMAGDGKVIVDLYDDRPMAAGGQPVALERWEFPPEVLRLLLRKDVIGWGYTVFLPWVKTYRPDITQVHVRVCYVPHDAAPLYTVSPTLNFAPPDPSLVTGVAQASRPKWTPPGAPAATPASAQMTAAAQLAAQAIARTPPAVTAVPQAQPQVNMTPPMPMASPIAPPAGAVPGQTGTQAAVTGALPLPEPIRIPLKGNAPPVQPAGPPVVQPSVQPPAQPVAQPSVQPSQPIQQVGWVGMAKQ